jgi:enoyl-CoA hydratase
MEEHPIQTSIHGRVGLLSFNRPNLLNAFNTKLMDATNLAVSQFVEDNQIQCIIVNGNGRAFSAGFDMKESAQRNISTANEWRKILEEDFDFIMQFWECPKPTIAVAHGHCIGGAFELLMACDLAVSAESTMFGEPEVRFGSGIVALLAPWVTGPKQAKELLLTGDDKISAQRCFEMGIINKVSNDGEELFDALKIAKKITSSASKSVQLTKKAINRTYELAKMKQALREGLEIDVQIESDLSPERIEFNKIRKKEGLKAALNWRDKI